MTDTNNSLISLRLRVAIRKAALGRVDRSLYLTSFRHRFPWATKAETENTVSELIREGLLTKEKGTYGAPILVWHEENIK
jgi:hypothetical protein